MEPIELHGMVKAAINAGDIEGFVALYEPDARGFNEDGSVIIGHDAIREVVSDLMSLSGQMELTTRFAIEMGDIALLSNEWQFVANELKLSGITAEVARRQADGRWLYIIDNPYAVAVPDA